MESGQLSLKRMFLEAKGNCFFQHVEWSWCAIVKIDLGRSFVTTHFEIRVKVEKQGELELRFAAGKICSV